jgi:hypothetical protein
MNLEPQSSMASVSFALVRCLKQKEENFTFVPSIDFKFRVASGRVTSTG